MVYDIEESRISSEICDLDEEIKLMTQVIRTYEDYPVWRKAFERTKSRLEHDKEHQIRQLQIHHQKVKDSGIKF